MQGYPWYQPPENEAFPLEHEATSIRLLANGLRVEMKRVNVRCVHVAARVVCERELNRMLDATREQGKHALSITAMHLDHLLRHFAAGNLTIVCDRRGASDITAGYQA